MIAIDRPMCSSSKHCESFCLKCFGGFPFPLAFTLAPFVFGSVDALTRQYDARFASRLLLLLGPAF